jgi:MoxR-like ATPase
MREQLGLVIVGQDEVIEQLLISIFCRSHALLVGVPGLAKTLLVSTLSEVLDLEFKRIQFTPDLMPADITGTEVLEEDMSTGKRIFKFVRGPIFANMILADEINRTPPKTQAALLEAMQEHHVTIGEETYPLPEPFFVLATQNPIEQEGTYPLPEAQLDRFLLNVLVAYPDAETEQRILALVRAEAQASASQAPPAPLSQADLFAARQAVLSLHMDPAVETYLVQLILATRNPAPWGDDLARWIEYGASPRGTLALDRCARARAWLEGRDFVTPEDIQALVHDVLRHRVLVSFEAQAQGISTDHVLDELLARVPVA